MADAHNKLYQEALEAAREALEMMDADGGPVDGYTEDEVANAVDMAGDRFVAWVGVGEGHPWYCRNEKAP